MNHLKLFISNIHRLTLGVALLCVSACSNAPLNKSEPLLLAHGANIGTSDYNSPAAVNEALADGRIDGVEVDVVLTRDLVPVLAHDPWLNTPNCRHVDGSPMEYVLIRDVAFDALTSDYQCSYPSIDGEQESYHSVMALAAFLDQVRKRPEFHVYLDIKIQGGYTQNEEEYAKAVGNVVRGATMQNPLYIEVPTASAVALFDQHIEPERYRSVISYPAFYAGENWTWVGAVNAAKTFIFSNAPSKAATKAGADMVMSPAVVMSKAAAKKLQRNHVGFGTFLVEDKTSFDKACAYGPALMIVDYISAGGC